MSDEHTDVLVAVYQDLDAAGTDFDGLMGVVASKAASIEGAILVTHDEDGEVTVRTTPSTSRRCARRPGPRC